MVIQVECYKVDPKTSPPRLQRINEQQNVKIRIISFDEETIKSVKLKLGKEESSKKDVYDNKMEMKTNEMLIVQTRGFGEIKMEVQIIYEEKSSSKTELINTKRILSVVAPQFIVGVLFNII